MGRRLQEWKLVRAVMRDRDSITLLGPSEWHPGKWSVEFKGERFSMSEANYDRIRFLKEMERNG